MGLPTSSFAVAVLIVLALPGFIQAGVRRWARGESADDRDLGLSVARGLVFAVALSGLYMGLFGKGLGNGIKIGTKAEELAIADVRAVAVTVLVLYVVVPTCVAILFNWSHILWQRPSWAKGLPIPQSKHGYTSIPSAWDHAVRKNQQVWVKVHRANGEWVGGWFTQGSSATVYPEPRSIYIHEQWAMTNEGAYERAVPDTGVYLAIRDDDLVIWTRARPGGPV